ncbi:MAG: hypothetical protein LBG80_02300 [Bacteroidales bacterium]|jgi:hypothetical protein|nr:hypothetical protein [Bacteroidales bacterium]
MREYKQQLTVLVVTISLMCSCVSKKPAAKYVSAPDYNQRIAVEEPYYKKRANGFGITVGVALPVGGAVAGYFASPFKYQDGDQRKTSRVGGAVAGALVGAGIAYFAGRIAGYGKEVEVKEVTEWIRKANPEYRYLKGANNNFTIIHPSIEQNYTVKNITDAKDFKLMFPNSLYTNNVVLSGINNLSRTELPVLIETFPFEQSTEQAKIKYIISSLTFDDAISAARRYTVNYDVESYLLNLIKNVDNGIKFLEFYPNTSYRKIAVLNAFKESNQTKQDWIKLQTAFGNDIYLTKSDFANVSDNVKQNYYYGMYELSNPGTVDKFDEFNAQYSWLSYSYKKNDMLSFYWDIVNRSYSSGMIVIEQFKEILANPVYENLTITDVDIKSIMEEKFKEEATKNIFIRSKHIIGSQNKEWETWKQSQYTAGMVSEYGAIQFIVYGEVENTSKFALPIEIAAGGSLTQTTRLTGQGNFMNALVNFAGMLGAPTTQVELIAAETGRCFYPAIPSRGKIFYAILLDFGEGVTKTGINVFDLLKASSELSITHDTVGLRFSSIVPTQEQLEKQNTWLQFAHQGLPSSELVDFIRNEAVRQEIWKIRHEEYKERMRETMQRAASDIDPDAVSIPSNYKIVDWLGNEVSNEWIPELGDDPYKRIRWEEGGKVIQGIIRKNRHHDNFYYQWDGSSGYRYKTEKDAIDALYVKGKYDKLRKIGKD